MSTVADDLALALELADQADTLTMDRFGALDLRIETKPDLTPVTDADRGAEEALRASLATARPDDTVFGEEFGGTTTLTGRQWVIDPIDGTKNFVRGVPVWATLIALLEDGVPTVGVVSAPALARRWWAGQGQGAFGSFAGTARKLSVSGVADLASASLSYSDLTTGWDDRRDKSSHRKTTLQRRGRSVGGSPKAQGCTSHTSRPFTSAACRGLGGTCCGTDHTAGSSTPSPWGVVFTGRPLRAMASSVS